MLIKKIIHLLFPLSAFKVVEINLAQYILVVEDVSMGLQIKVIVDKFRKLKSAEVVAQYDVLIKYEDGTSNTVCFLK